MGIGEGYEAQRRRKGEILAGALRKSVGVACKVQSLDDGGGEEEQER